VTRLSPFSVVKKSLRELVVVVVVVVGATVVVVVVVDVLVDVVVDVLVDVLVVVLVLLDVVVVVVSPLLYIMPDKASNCLEICQSKLLFVLQPICLEGIAMLVNFI
jgi:hypothetical protein